MRDESEMVCIYTTHYTYVYIYISEYDTEGMAPYIYACMAIGHVIFSVLKTRKKKQK